MARNGNGNKNEVMFMGDFLEQATESPLMLESPAARAFRRIFTDPGFERIRVGDDEQLMRALEVSADTILLRPRSLLDMEGRELELEQIRLFLASAAANAEQARQMLILVGATGTGKSTIVGRMHKLLEGSPIWQLDGCPMHEHPFRILPRKRRAEYAEQFGILINPTADCCHVCRRYLHEELKNDWLRFPVSRTKISAREGGLGIGAAVMFPVDPLNADISIMNGRVNLAMLDNKEIPEGDPRTLLYTGYFHHAEQGLLEVREIFKVGRNIELLNNFIFATQEKEIPGPGNYGRVSVDCIIIGHSNLAEFRDFLAEPTNEALLSRSEIVEFRHLLRWSAEARAYEREMQRSTYGRLHRSPHLLETASRYAVSTRLGKHSLPSISAILATYNGESETKRPSELLKESPDDGWIGLDLRFSVKALGTAYATVGACVIWPEMRRVIEKRLLTPMFTPQEQERYRELLNFADADYLARIGPEFIEAVIGAQEEHANAFFNNYAETVRQWLRKKLANANEAELATEKNFLKSVEDLMPLKPEQHEGVRREILRIADEYASAGETFRWQDHEMLRAAVMRHLVARFADLVDWPGEPSRMTNLDARRLAERVRQYLIDQKKYCEVCAGKTMQYTKEHRDQILSI